MNIKLLAIQPGECNKSKLVEHAARTCYRSKPASTEQGRRNFLLKLANKKHLSIFEHARYARLHQGGNPYQEYWGIRYGANITERDGGVFVVSMNARNEMELIGNNPVCDPRDNNLLRYDDLSDNEKIHHASATFEISAFSRTGSHQLVRHRLASFSQESQRYVGAGNPDAIAGRFDFIIPPSVANKNDAGGLFDSFMYDIWRVYESLRDAGSPKEDARFVLPNATATRLVMTQNFHSWLHFCTVRCHPSAQWEIRAVAIEILHQLYERAPNVFGELYHAM